MSVSNICLLCLQHSDDLFDVFGKRGIELSTGSTLKEHFWFEVHESDEKSICGKCWWTVQSFHDFYNSVKLNHQHQSIKPVIVETNEHTAIVELLHNIKTEPDIDIENDINDCSPDITHSPAGESCMEAERTLATAPTIKRKKRIGASVSSSLKTTSPDITDTPHSHADESCTKTELHRATDSPTIKRKSVRLNHQRQSIKQVIVEANEHIEIVELLHNIKNEPSIDIENDINDCSPDITDTPHSPAGESCMEAERTLATAPTIKRIGALLSSSSKTTSPDITDTPHSPAGESCTKAELHRATDSPTIKRKSVRFNHQRQSIKQVIVEANEHIEIVEFVHNIKNEPSIDIENDINNCSPDIIDTPHSPASESYMETERTVATAPTIKRTKRIGALVSSSSKTTSPDITDTPHSPAGESCMEAERTLAAAPTIKRKKRLGALVSSSSNATSPDITDTPHSPAGESCTEAELHCATPTIKRRKYVRRSMSDKYNTDAHTTLLSTYFNMSCDLCDVPLSSYRDTMKHYKDVHNINKGYMICCSKKFFRLSFMLQHCQLHMNPDTFKCDHCLKSFSSKRTLQIHVNIFHAPEHEKVFSCNYCDDTFCKQAYLNVHMKKSHTSKLAAEGGNAHSPEDKQKFQCAICKRSFAKRWYLTRHMKVKHVKGEDKQFECYICHKRFAVLLYLNGHINRIHRQQIQSHICEVCAKPFTTKIAYELHYRNIHTKILQKVQCDKCGKWLRHKQALASHRYWHRQQSKMETCSICGRVSSNIQAHIRQVHREGSLECTICGKKFKKQLILKEHRAIHAGVKDLYKCTFCTKTFRWSTNMCAHRKRVHPAELEQEKASQKSFTPATPV